MKGGRCSGPSITPATCVWKSGWIMCPLANGAHRGSDGRDDAVRCTACEGIACSCLWSKGCRPKGRRVRGGDRTSRFMTGPRTNQGSRQCRVTIPHRLRPRHARTPSMLSEVPLKTRLSPPYLARLKGREAGANELLPQDIGESIRIGQHKVIRFAAKRTIFLPVIRESVRRAAKNRRHRCAAGLCLQVRDLDYASSQVFSKCISRNWCR